VSRLTFGTQSDRRTSGGLVDLVLLRCSPGLVIFVPPRGRHAAASPCKGRTSGIDLPVPVFLEVGSQPRVADRRVSQAEAPLRWGLAADGLFVSLAGLITRSASISLPPAARLKDNEVA
jgi:hypothetical protein